ncbi:MAG: hypothetical protein V4447_10705 [Pseudomonadota bacterium]
MSTILGINPMAVTNAAGFFGVQSDGFTQGVAHDDPAVRYQLAGGFLSAAETLPMWGGVAITESLPVSGNNGHYGPSITRAATTAAITGFSVFNQSHNAINSPENQVPILASGMTVNFYRLGSLARIPLAADPSLVAALATGSINQQVTWDINNSRLVPYDASTPTVSVTSMTSTYANGIATIAVVTAAASNVGAVGDTINISGAVNGGTGGNAIINGNQTVTAFTDNQHFSFQVPVSGSGVIGTITGTIVLNQNTGALPCKILQLGQNNSRIVGYNPITALANWLDNKSCVLVQI